MLPPKYVPVLRWKPAEQFAIGRLWRGDRAFVTPLIELPPKRLDQLDPAYHQAQLCDIAHEILETWGTNPLYIDLGLVNQYSCLHDGHHPLHSLLAKCTDLGIQAIPVTGVHRAWSYQRAFISASIRSGTACIRLSKREVLGTDLQDGLFELLEVCNLGVDKVHLIVDLGHIGEDVPHLAEIFGQIPLLNEWNSLVFVGGAFPENLLKVKRWTCDPIPRLEWAKWTSESTSLDRIPDFGDYTIQHGVFCEPPNPCFPSASVRYTTLGDWLVLRGEGGKSPAVPRYKQFRSHAQMLVEMEQFKGPGFSWGDRYVFERKTHHPHSGGLKEWLQAGINHHITFVVRQLLNHVGFPLDDVIRQNRIAIQPPIPARRAIRRSVARGANPKRDSMVELPFSAEW